MGATWALSIYRAKGPGRAQIQLAKVRNRVRQSERTWFYDVLKTVCLTCAFMPFMQDSLKTWEFLDPLFCSFHTSYSVYSSTDRHPCAISEHFAPSDVHLKSRRPRQISRFNPRLCVQQGKSPQPVWVPEIKGPGGSGPSAQLRNSPKLCPSMFQMTRLWPRSEDR